MIAIAKKKKTFEITDDGKMIAELIYKGFWSNTAFIKLTDGRTYNIKPESVFSKYFTIDDGQMAIGRLKTGLFGKKAISITGREDYTLITKGFLSSFYKLDNYRGEIIVSFKPKFNWKAMKYNLEISYDKKPDDLLIVLGVYLTNYILSLQTRVIQNG